MQEMTEKQKRVLDFINDFGRGEGMAPTISEISKHLNISPATVFSHVRALQKKGLLHRSSKARSISLPKAEQLHHFSMTLSIPLLGRISAGVPMEAEQNIERYVQVDPTMLRHGHGPNPLFAVKVMGESMRDAGILDGDLLIAQKAENVKNGSIVVALLEDSVTVKYLYSAEEQWELRPANPDFSSRFVAKDALQIQGVVVGLIREY